MNTIVLIGRLTRDPDLKTTGSGISVANASIAVDRQYKNEDGTKTTDFINLVAWKKTAEILCQFCKKGSQLAVQGSLQMRKYQTREGENRTVYEVNIEQLQSLNTKGTGENASQQPDQPAPVTEGEDDLPF